MLFPVPCETSADNHTSVRTCARCLLGDAALAYTPVASSAGVSSKTGLKSSSKDPTCDGLVYTPYKTKHGTLRKQLCNNILKLCYKFECDRVVRKTVDWWSCVHLPVWSSSKASSQTNWLADAASPSLGSGQWQRLPLHRFAQAAAAAPQIFAVQSFAAVCAVFYVAVRTSTSRRSARISE